MSEQTFSVGEIAILVCPDMPGDYGLELLMYVGEEVRIHSPLRFDSAAIDFMVYEIVVSNGDLWAVTPYCLRKRRPPQNWKSLCNLTNVPAEEGVTA